MDARGQFFYIKRPWKDPFAKPPWWRGILDFVLFPFRLLFAVFQFLNFFTVRYTGNTLTTTGGAQQREADLKQMMIWGNMIDARQAARTQGDTDAPDLVPKNWELICQDHAGTASTLARGVVSFDLCSDGGVLYSNGSAIFHRHPDGKTERIVKDALISKVVALP
jgi:hypothetical protein